MLGNYNPIRKENYQMPSNVPRKDSQFPRGNGGGTIRLDPQPGKRPIPNKGGGVSQFPRGNGGGTVNINPPGPQARGPEANKQRVTDRWNTIKQGGQGGRFNAKKKAINNLQKKYSSL